MEWILCFITDRIIFHLCGFQFWRRSTQLRWRFKCVFLCVQSHISWVRTSWGVWLHSPRGDQQHSSASVAPGPLRASLRELPREPQFPRNRHVGFTFFLLNCCLMTSVAILFHMISFHLKFGARWKLWGVISPLRENIPALTNFVDSLLMNFCALCSVAFTYTSALFTIASLSWFL